MYINHAVLKRQLAQWVQVKSFTNVSATARYMQQLKILEDMFFPLEFYCNNIAYQHDDVVVYIFSFIARQVYLYTKFHTQR